MDNTPHPSSLREKVQNAIASGNAPMRSRSYFIFAATLSVLGALILTLALLYLASFIFFTMRSTGVLLLPSFGLRGVGAFIQSLPWLLIAVCLLFVIVLELFVQRYSFAYRRPLLYTMVGTVAIVIVGGVVIAHTRLHDNLLHSAQAGQLPIAGRLYRGYYTKRLPQVHAGFILQMTETGFRVENRSGEVVTVIVTPHTRFPRGAGFANGEEIMIFGARRNGDVEAYGIRALHEKARRNYQTQQYRILLPE